MLVRRREECEQGTRDERACDVRLACAHLHALQRCLAGISVRVYILLKKLKGRRRQVVGQRCCDDVGLEAAVPKEASLPPPRGSPRGRVGDAGGTRTPLLPWYYDTIDYQIEGRGPTNHPWERDDWYWHKDTGHEEGRAVLRGK